MSSITLETIAQQLRAGQINALRFAWADQHGILRGKTVTGDAAISALKTGVSITSTLIAKDTSGRTVFPVFAAGGNGFGIPALKGAADVLMVPDASTYRQLPWADKTGWVLCDLVHSDAQSAGAPVPFCTRYLLRKTLDKAAARSLIFNVGIEVELHIFRRLNNDWGSSEAASPGVPGRAPAVALLNPGYQYLAEQRFDLMETALAPLRTQLLALGLPIRTMEVEFGPSQCEITLDVLPALAAADAFVLLRSAVKQICHRLGFHATFMCRPRIEHVMSSGWHLHQSLADAQTGRNRFTPTASDGANPLSPIGMQYLAGLITHAQAATVFAVPTINGYKRFRPNSLAPDRVLWGRDNRAAMLRVLGQIDDKASRIENRVGEPAANPYLYLSSQLMAGLNGLDNAMIAPPSADAPYETPAATLPTDLHLALKALDTSVLYRKGFGDDFVDYFIALKRAELARYEQEISAWEQREYFEFF